MNHLKTLVIHLASITILSLMISPKILAGGRTHGGDVVICTDRAVTREGKPKKGTTPPQVISVELLDFFEGRIKFPTWKLRSIRAVSGGLSSAIADVDQYYSVDPDLSQRIFRSMTGISISYGTNADVPEINDEGHTLPIPQHCYIKQVAIQAESPISGTSQIIVNEEWYDRLPLDQQVALIRHESLMEIFIEDFSILETEGLRELNYLLSTTETTRINSTAWMNALSRAGYSNDDLECAQLILSPILDQDIRQNDRSFNLLAPVASQYIRNKSCLKYRVSLNQQVFNEDIIRLRSPQVIRINEQTSPLGGYVLPNTEILYRFPTPSSSPLLNRYKIRGYKNVPEGTALVSQYARVNANVGQIDLIQLSPTEIPLLHDHYSIPREIRGCTSPTDCEFSVQVGENLNLPSLRRFFVDFRNELQRAGNELKPIFIFEAELVDARVDQTISLDLFPTLPRKVEISVRGQGVLRIIEAKTGASSYRFSCDSPSCEIVFRGKQVQVHSGDIWRSY